MEHWNEVEQFLTEMAGEDLRECCDEIHPCLVGFSGEHPRMVAFVRPFPKGEYADPLTELLALAMPLDVDRLALSIGGRAWSLEDPVPPVLPEADLRQRVLSMELVDGSTGRARSRSVLVPFARHGDCVTWDEPVHKTGATGWIPSALALAVRDRRKLAAPPTRIREQAERCVGLGHELYLPPQVQQELGMAVPAQ